MPAAAFTATMRARYDDPASTQNRRRGGPRDAAGAFAGRASACVATGCPVCKRRWRSYRLDLASELLFVGDAGTTEASRPSRRVGFELANYYKLGNWLTVDADVAFARARFRDADPTGNRIPGAVEGVASLAIAVDNLGPWFGAAQLRYFRPRPLLEPTTVSAPAARSVFNARAGLSGVAQDACRARNQSGQPQSVWDYYYTSRLPARAVAGVDAIHFHPVESRSFRLTLAMNF